jgi:hypothetical protein
VEYSSAHLECQGEGFLTEEAGGDGGGDVGLERDADDAFDGSRVGGICGVREDFGGFRPCSRGRSGIVSIAKSGRRGTDAKVRREIR